MEAALPNLRGFTLGEIIKEYLVQTGITGAAKVEAKVNGTAEVMVIVDNSDPRLEQRRFAAKEDVSIRVHQSAVGGSGDKPEDPQAEAEAEAETKVEAEAESNEQAPAGSEAPAQEATEGS